ALGLTASQEGVAESDRIESVYSTLRMLLAEGWSESRMASLIWNLCVVLCSTGSTLWEASDILANPFIRRAKLRQVTDPAALRFFAEYSNLSARAQREWALPVTHRLGRLLRSTPIRNM